ncbi:E3 ubiquitin-protein ligase UBR1-like [Malaya genurostris]|uniref:E3 ubiquitin-protein ligase UBR1-like n=1 Tax=Malaya genurostris TaxID=325434 RepID=UPI0026F3D191|nr:E3 ubiquitin-protein ligase UBR1-like [Malaya genurostris]
MEASDTPAPVVPSPPAFISRPGPVGGCGEGGFQTFLHGKYLSFPSYVCADSFSGSSSMTSTHRTLGRNAVGIMEASDPLATVVPSQPALVSRPGPVCESGEEVFQPVAAGKYTSNLHNSTIDCLPASSSNLHRLPALRNVLKIHVYYQNAGGMNSCLENYRLACSDDCFDIIALTETWLTENTLSIQAFDSNYEVFRTDRSSRNSNKIIGGGVLVAIRRRLKAQLLQNASENNVEQVCVKISLSDSSSLFLCVVYLPPDRIRDLSLIDTHIQSIDEITSVHMRPSDEIFIIGDFNFPGLKWIPASDGFLYVDPLHSSFHTGITNLLDRYSLNLLRQVNHVQNENGRILDLCFSSQSDCAPRIIAAPFPLVKSVRHHPPLHIVLESDGSSHDRYNSRIVSYNFKKADYNSIIVFLSNLTWSEILDNDDVNLATQSFSNVMTYAIDQYVPKRIIQPSKQAPWQTAELIRMDPTCVLCSMCFKKSSHRLHKYKMCTSGGGGCCDCGDSEAWKRDPICEEHKTNVADIADFSVITEKVRLCSEIIFKGVLQYCTKTLQVQSNSSLSDFGDEDVDDYCTILYNDETHTFEQVIQTLTAIVKCSQKEAIEYVTSIDREGRAVVKCASFEQCKKLKEDIENRAIRSTMTTKSSPLKVTVLHKSEVACQHLAMQILGWFQDFVTKHSTFRSIFCTIVGEVGVAYNLKQIISNDHKLWKSARTCWHRLLISGMLMEYNNKKALAVMFTKLYANLMQDFIRDDHYHSFSIASLSVQLFTVPTIAHHLIAHELAFFKLMHTFYSESIEKYIKNKHLQFAKNTSTMNVFKRASYILIDLKYMLSFKPDVWTQELRTGFLHGVQILIRLLKCMQGMDAVTRQIGQHMEYEPEWETAFTLHLKLSHLITLILEWCSTDKVVLVKVYRMLLAALTEIKFIVSETNVEVKELADHSASCLIYDVASKPVSIHLPLTRFLAGLYIHFEKFNLTYDTVASSLTDKPTPEQIIEPVLCTRTMISQVYAGMWRRNGYSLLNQLYFYRNVKCRYEMLDRDIAILQIGASLIESNEYLIHIMSKFNLIEWTYDDFDVSTVTNPEEDGIRQIINMVDEFLELLIVIIGERFVPGIGMVTEETRIKKEIIQQLCIKPYSHSELNRALNEDCSSETGMESVIDEIATFEKPTKSDKKGVYKLKAQYFSWYNIYFYHYSKEDKSKSEEAQRKRCKERNELVCCPPPELPQLTQSFSMIANLLQCDVMLLVMNTVLKRTLDLKAITFAESHLQKVLHLIGYALQEENSGHYPFLKFIECSSKTNLLAMLEDLVNYARVESQRDLLLWVIQKYKHLMLKMKNQNMDEDFALSKQERASSVNHTELERLEKEERAKMAAQRRAQILAQMQSAQKKFMSSNAELFEDNSEEERINVCTMDWQSEETNKLACLGSNRRIQRPEEARYRCILCSEESPVTKNDVCMVYAAFVQKSSVLSRYQQTDDHGQLKYLETSTHPSPHVSTCGHVMHATCFEEFFSNEMIKENRRPYRNRTPMLFDTEKREFLCPLCRCLSNALLPLLPALGCFNESSSFLKIVPDEIDFKNWFEMMEEFVKAFRYSSKQAQRDPDSEDAIRQVQLVYRTTLLNRFTSAFDVNTETMNEHTKPLVSEIIEDYIDKFCLAVHEVAPFPTTMKHFEEYVVTWMSCAYTIESLEMLLRATEKPLSGELSIRFTSCLSGFVRVSSVLGNNIKAYSPNFVDYMCDLHDTLLGRKKSKFLEWDVFGMMTSLIFATRCVLFSISKEDTIPKGSSLEHSILIAMFLVNAVRIILTHEVKFPIVMDIDGVLTEGDMKHNEYLIDIFKKYNIYHDDERSLENLILPHLQDTVREQSRTFLRCASLLFHAITDIELPKDDGYDSLTAYLGLNSDISSYFSNDTYYQFISSIIDANHQEIQTVKQNIRRKQSRDIVPIIQALPPIRQLIELPDDYSDLINSVSFFSCPNNVRDESRNPTMCLVCGEVLCSQSFCCQKDLDKNSVGSCTYHVHTCGAGIGIFLRIRDSEVLLLGMNKGCFIPAPYLDEYGETDQGLRRGNPLRLCKERYRKLHIIWLSHGIHEEIARRTETQQTLFATQWQNL